MGVEQDYQRCVLAGKAYENSWKEYNGLRNKELALHHERPIGYCSQKKF
jgi:hypothetical protein